MARQTAESMIKFFEQYYGPYEPIVRSVVLKYCKPWASDTISAVMEWVCENVENRFKMPPDVATLKRAFSAVIERVEQKRMELRALPEPPMDPEIREKVAEFLRGLVVKTAFEMPRGKGGKETAK